MARKTAKVGQDIYVTRITYPGTNVVFKIYVDNGKVRYKGFHHPSRIECGLHLENQEIVNSRFRSYMIR